MVHWTDQTNRWQANDKGHSGSGEVWGGAILLLLWGLLILGWWLWTRYFHKMLWHMGQIQQDPARPYLPLISHRFQRQSLKIHVLGVPRCMQAKPGPHTYLACIACCLTNELWCAGCESSPSRTKSVCSISWRGRSLMNWQRYTTPANSDGMGIYNVEMLSWRKSRNSIP